MLLMGDFRSADGRTKLRRSRLLRWVNYWSIVCAVKKKKKTDEVRKGIRFVCHVLFDPKKRIEKKKKKSREVKQSKQGDDRVRSLIKQPSRLLKALQECRQYPFFFFVPFFLLSPSCSFNEPIHPDGIHTQKEHLIFFSFGANAKRRQVLADFV